MIDSVPDDVVPSPTPPEPPAGIRGRRRSIARGNFARRRSSGMRRRGAERDRSIRLAPDRLDAQLVKGARQRSAQVTFDGARLDARPGVARRGGHLGAIALAAIDAGARRGWCAARRRATRVREQGINYLVHVARSPARAIAGSPTSRTASTSRATARPRRAADQLTLNVHAVRRRAVASTTAASCSPGRPAAGRRVDELDAARRERAPRSAGRSRRSRPRRRPAAAPPSDSQPGLDLERDAQRRAGRHACRPARGCGR